MKRHFARWAIPAFALSIFVSGCAGAYTYQAVRGPTGKRHRPTVLAVWAHSEIGWGDRWKIYIRASDPDGDLDKVWLGFARFGRAVTVRIDGGMQKTVNGFVLTRADLGLETFTDLHDSLHVQAEDRAGNMSAPRIIKFSVLDRSPGVAPGPPPGYRAKKLGQFDWPQDVDPNEGSGDRE